jgi:hypothetical protein
MVGIRVKILIAAAFLSLTAPAALAAQKTVITLYEAGFIDNNIISYMATSDPNANQIACYVNTGTPNPCSKTDSQFFSPKNMGNIICLPTTTNSTITSACQSLLATGQNGECNANPIANICANTTNKKFYRASCSWRTSTNSSITATINWSVTKQADDTWQVDCNQTGYAAPFTSN